MWKMLSAVITSDMVEERHFFMEWLLLPEIVWGLRIILVAVLIAVLVIYFKCKGRKDE